MKMVGAHKDLLVWRKAVTLASRIHELTAHFSGQQQALSTRMCNCAVAAASQIAEGAAHSNRAEYIRFLGAARGHLSELQVQACICLELKIIAPEAKLEEQIAEVGGHLDALLRRLREHRERARGFEYPAPPANKH